MAPVGTGPASSPKRTRRLAQILAGVLVAVVVAVAAVAFVTRPSETTTTASIAKASEQRAGTTPAPAVSTESADPSSSAARGLHLVDWRTPELAGTHDASLLTRVGADRALYFAWSRTEDGRNRVTGRLVLVDVRQRSVVWAVPSVGIGNEAPYSMVGHVVDDVVLLHTFTGALIAVDLATGAVRSTADSGWSLEACGIGGSGECPDLDGDVLLGDGGSVIRVPAARLTDARWTAPGFSGGLAVVGSRVIGGGEAVDAATGKRVPWSGPAGLDYGYSGGQLVAVGPDLLDWSVAVIDPRSGRARFSWKGRNEDPHLLAGGLLIVWRGDVATAMELATGRTRWTRSSKHDESAAYPKAVIDADRIQIPSEDGLVSDIVAVRTGSRMFSLPTTLEQENALPWQVLASARGRLVIEDALQVVVLDERDGSVKSSLPTDLRTSPIDMIGDVLVQSAPSQGVHLATLELD